MKKTIEYLFYKKIIIRSRHGEDLFYFSNDATRHLYHIENVKCKYIPIRNDHLYIIKHYKSYVEE